MLFGLVIAVACGGQTVEGPEEPAPAAGGASSSGTGSSGGSKPTGDLTLGPCVKGFDRFKEPGRPCAWVADGLCYDTKAAACACECPRRNGTVCSSSFDDGPDGRVEVHCS